MTDKNHKHSWVRWKVTKDGAHYYKCSHPECNSTRDREFLVGKMTVCPNCHQNEFVLTPGDLKRAKPLCPQSCSNTKEHVMARTMNIDKAVGSIMDILFTREENNGQQNN